MLDMKT